MLRFGSFGDLRRWESLIIQEGSLGLFELEEFMMSLRLVTSRVKPVAMSKSSSLSYDRVNEATVTAKSLEQA